MKIIVFLFIYIITACLSQAFDVRVNSFEDLPDSSPGDGIFSTGRTLPDGSRECTLRAAIMEVNSLRVWPDGIATIIIPSGRYVLTRQQVTSAEEDRRQRTTEWDAAEASATGDLDLGNVNGGNITLRGEGPSYPIIDANGIDRGIDISHPFKQPSDLTAYVLENLEVQNGATEEGGGGVRISHAPDRVFVRNCVIHNNRVGPSGLGGGIWNARGNRVSITGCVIDSNEAGGGGGIFQSYEGRGIEVLECTIRNNRAAFSNSPTRPTFAGGGGIGAESIYAVPSVGICNSLIQGNSSEGEGGGLRFLGTFATVANTTISGNRAADGGGGVFCGGNSRSNGNLLCNSVTIAYNDAGGNYGAGIFNGSPGSSGFSDVVFYNSILVYNTAAGPDGRFANRFGNLTSAGYNMVYPSPFVTEPVFTHPTDLVADPGLAPLADNGGPTLTHAIAIGSPAFESGPRASVGIVWPLVFAFRPDAWPTDQRGLLRPRGGANADRGAYEFTLPVLILDVPIETYPALDSIYAFIVPFTLSGDASATVIGVTPGKGVDNLKYEISSDHRSVTVRAELSRALPVPKNRRSNQSPLFSIQIQRPTDRPAFLRHNEAEFEGKVTIKKRLQVHPLLPQKGGNAGKSFQLVPGLSEAIPLVIDP